MKPTHCNGWALDHHAHRRTSHERLSDALRAARGPASCVITTAIRRVARGRRPVRLRQKHAVAHPRHAGSADVRQSNARGAIRSPSRNPLSPSSAIATSASCFRIITCCRNARCWKTCSCHLAVRNDKPAELVDQAKKLLDRVGLRQTARSSPGRTLRRRTPARRGRPGTRLHRS